MAIRIKPWFCFLINVYMKETWLYRSTVKNTYMYMLLAAFSLMKETVLCVFVIVSCASYSNL